MFRSPISPASVCTSARSSSRSVISRGESGTEREIFFPGIFIPNHQSKKNIATTATVMRTLLSNKRRNMPESRDLKLGDLLPKPQSTEDEKQDRHYDEDGEVRPVFEQMCAAQNDRAHERDEISRRKECAEGVKNPGHGFPRKNETGEKDARQEEHHRHLQGLHLVFGLGSDKQTQAEQRENVNEGRKHHPHHIAYDRNVKHKAHNEEENHRHGHADAQIRNKFAEHQPCAAQWADKQLLKGPTFSFADKRHGSSDSCAALQNHADHARHKKVRTAHRRFVKHLRANIDGDTVSTGFAQKRFH